MTNLQKYEIEWLIRHRGEPEAEAWLNRMAEENDRDVVEDTLCHIWAGFYDAEPTIDITITCMRKSQTKNRRDRKIAENRKHYARVQEKKGVIA